MPLTERHRPKNLDDVVGHHDHVDRLREFVKRYKDGIADMPHILFHGPAGTGKTSAGIAVARELYGDRWRQFVLETNASDERGIDSIRGRIKSFAQTGSLGEAFNIILLDECDNLTPDAQAALRRTMEIYSHNCRFIMCCNNIRKVIPPIQSRCARFQFGPIDDEAMVVAVTNVLEKEGIEAEEAAIGEIVTRSNGSMRDALNLIESAPHPITAESVESVAIDPGVWEDIIALAVTKGGQKEAEKVLVKTIINGSPPGDVFQGFFDALNARMDDKKLDVIIPVLGEYEYRVAVGGSFELQARCFIRHLAKLGKVNG